MFHFETHHRALSGRRPQSHFSYPVWNGLVRGSLSPLVQLAAAAVSGLAHVSSSRSARHRRIGAGGLRIFLILAVYQAAQIADLKSVGNRRQGRR